MTYQSAPKGGLSVFYTVPSEELSNPLPIPGYQANPSKPAPIPVNPVSGQDTIQRIKGLIDGEQNKFFEGGSSPTNIPGK